MGIYEDLLAVKEQLTPVVYYADSEFIPAGKVLHYDGSGASDTPEYYVFNPADMEAFRQAHPWPCRLVHLRDRK